MEEDTGKITVDSKKYLQLKHDIEKILKRASAELIQELLDTIDLTVKEE